MVVEKVKNCVNYEGSTLCRHLGRMCNCIILHFFHAFLPSIGVSEFPKIMFCFLKFFYFIYSFEKKNCRKTYLHKTELLIWAAYVVVGNHIWFVEESDREKKSIGKTYLHKAELLIWAAYVVVGNHIWSAEESDLQLTGRWWKSNKLQSYTIVRIMLHSIQH